MENDRVLAIVKFGPSQYIDQFVKGLLYMNTLGYFKRLEGDTTRYDPNEGVTSMWQGDGATLEIKVNDTYEHVARLCGPIRYWRDADQTVNVFCMYALLASASSNTPPIHLDNLGFGDTFAVVRDADEFLRRVAAAAVRSGHQLHHQLVEYIDDSTYTGPLGPFRKGSKFKYQSEFRIVLSPGTGEPYPFDIGDISDIVLVGPLDELNSRLRISAPA